jgi:hypothetical protein
MSDDANAAQVRLDCAEIMEAEHSPFSEDQRMDDPISDSESGMAVPLPGPPPKGIQSQLRGVSGHVWCLTRSIRSGR